MTRLADNTAERIMQGGKALPVRAPALDYDELRHALALIFTLHRVIEIRAIRAERGYGRPVNMAGFFDDVEAAIKSVVALPRCKAVYFTLNRIPVDLAAIRYNRLDVADEAGLTADRHISRRVLMLVDFDPKKPHPEISATAAEHAVAEALAVAVAAALADDFGWPNPIMFDSGNGFGLWYRIDLPADDGGFVQRVLSAMAAKFSSADVTIDTAVCNAARITKLPGTVARKGDHTPQRPHRVARIISQVDSFNEVGFVRTELLQEFADAFAPAPATPAPAPGKAAAKTRPGRKSDFAYCAAYLAKLPDSIQGEHGSDRLYQAACICIRFGLDDAEAMAALGTYNTTKCTPPWNEKELRHKLADAARAVDAAGERGSMIKESAHIRRVNDALRLTLEDANV